MIKKMAQVKIVNKKPVEMTSILIKNCYTDRLIYKSNDVNFFTNEYKKVIIYNRQFHNKSKIVAILQTLDGTMLEKNSDEIVKIIGQKQFEILFMALCSVISQEFRIKGILSILTAVKSERSDDSNGSQNNGETKVNAQCQTDEIRISTSAMKKRRIRKHVAPYVVQDVKPPERKLRKLVIDVPHNRTKKQNELNNKGCKTDDCNRIPELPVLQLEDENTNDSTFTSFSYTTTDTLLNDPYSITKDVDNHTLSVSETNRTIENSQKIKPLKEEQISTFKCEENANLLTKTTVVDSLNNTMDVPLSNSINLNSLSNSNNLLSKSNNPLEDNRIEALPSYKYKFPDRTSLPLPLPMKPEDPFHIVTMENQKYVTKSKLIELQMKIDEKLCYHPMDDEGNLPIHIATLNNDLELLKRQCFILNKKNETVDILANDLTALKLSLFLPTVNATAVLLQFNADPLYVDDGHSSYFHIAAELKTDHLSVLIEYCRNNARKIISENEELQSKGWDLKTDKEISEDLLHHICSICDNQGYTPLMLASNMGHYENVKLLLESSFISVNKQMPNTGNTALYLAVYRVCNMASGRFTRSNGVDNFKSTIECLLQYGADPTIDNYVGSNVTLLLTEFPMVDLITLISNYRKSTNLKTTMFNGDFQNLMLIKENDKINIQNINNKTNSNQVRNISPTSNSGQNDFKPTTANTFHKFRKIAANLPTVTKKNGVRILSNFVMKSPQMNPESTNSLKSIQESTKIKPIVISQRKVAISKDNFIILSSGKSTNTNSIATTQSTNSTHLINSLPKINLSQKKMIVMKRSVQRIDLVKETGIANEKIVNSINAHNALKRKNDEISSSSNKLNK